MFVGLLLFSVIGITAQQIARKAYNSRIQNGVFTFTTLSIIFALIVFFITSGGKLDFSGKLIPYALAFAIAYASASIGAFLAISTGPISITTLLIQYSLIIPTFYGVFLLKEETSLFLYIGIALLLVSLLLVNIEGEKKEKRITFKWGVFALVAFIGNGVCSMVQKMQQVKFGGQLKSEFMILSLAICVVSIGIIALIFERRDAVKKVTSGPHLYIICGVANGLVNLFTMMLAKWPASIVFPILSAGGIIATAAIGVSFYKEKLSIQQIIGLVLGTTSIVFLNL